MPLVDDRCPFNVLLCVYLSIYFLIAVFIKPWILVTSSIFYIKVSYVSLNLGFIGAGTLIDVLLFVNLPQMSHMLQFLA